MPNPLESTTGKSEPAKDWNFAQSGYGGGAEAHEAEGSEGGEAAAGNKDGGYSTKLVPWKWRIHFNLTGAQPGGDATLTLAIASADRAKIDVYVNDESKPVTTVTPKVQGGNALLRESIHAKYCVEQATIPAGKLKSGENTITLVQTSVNGPGLHVMYDYLSLELP